MDARSFRVAHQIDTSASSEKPLVLDKASRIPLVLRQHAAEKFFEVLRAKKISKHEAIAAALRLELDLYSEAGKDKSNYKSNLIANISILKGGKPHQPKPIIGSTASLEFMEVATRLEELLVPLELLEEINFPCAARSIRVEQVPEQEVECSRCSKPFIPDTYYRDFQPEGCFFHYGRLMHLKASRERVYSCCNAGYGGDPCTTALRHVYYSKTLFTRDEVLSTVGWPTLSSQYGIVSLDGEMCHTERGLELCRLTMVDWNERRILDVIIEPEAPIVDYNTRFSGLSEEHYTEGGFKIVAPSDLESRIYTFAEMRQDVLPKIIGPHTILVGHSLENDLFHLKIDHKRIVDTSVLYPHNKGQPYRMALRDLTRVHLRQFVQEGSAGHDSYEDCVACLRLLKLKL